MLVQGQVAARQGDAAKARQIFQAVEQDHVCPVFLKWEAQHSLARLYENESQLNLADREYRAALATFEAARATVQHQDFQLSFLTNGARIYDDYVHFLVARGKTEDALRWADYNRARTLAEGLGLLAKGSGDHAGPPALNPREISRRAKGVLLFYWLGERQSYLWAITPRKVSLLPLPPGAEIDSLVQSYRKSLNGPEDVLASSKEGRTLYRTLVAPAKALLDTGTKVFIVPDGSLNNLNFETLVVDEPKPHYWIEDADVVNASSLRVLAASFINENSREKTLPRKLLLIGDSVAPSKEYPELPRAGEQMASVARHFPTLQQQVYQRERATPAAYLTTNPEKFSHIHFVAHGTASRLSPLDSAIVLSKVAIEPSSFKLYARDIVQHPMHANLVTISACYGAGSRAYSGEGLVGLAWAFLRAGAHNVIASLWEVTDASTEQLMDRFYDELDRGASPDAALRAAKLSLLRGSAFHNPFYWAPFQLYTGS
jgi:CHAT domain-containing protein